MTSPHNCIDWLEYTPINFIFFILKGENIGSTTQHHELARICFMTVIVMIISSIVIL